MPEWWYFLPHYERNCALILSKALAQIYDHVHNMELCLHPSVRLLHPADFCDISGDTTLGGGDLAGAYPAGKTLMYKNQRDPEEFNGTGSWFHMGYVIFWI